jgi:ATP-dependent helicase HrpA
VRAATLDELQELLERPWSPDEPTRDGRRGDPRVEDARRQKRAGGKVHGQGRGHNGRRDGPRGRGGGRKRR